MSDQIDGATDSGFLPNKCNETFIRLLTINHKRIYGYIRAIVPHWPDADDIMQETVLTMWRKFHTFQEETNFSAWGIAVARYRIQKFRSKSDNVRMTFCTETLEQITSQYMEALDEMETRMEAVEHCMARLQDRDRQLIRMRYERGLRAGAMAERVGLSVHGIYKALARIHHMLLRCVRRRLADWETA